MKIGPSFSLILLFWTMGFIAIQSMGLEVSQFRRQELILISGCTGTGKSTFGMECAVSKGILKCISTDTIRQVKRSESSNPAILRSSYEGTDEPVKQWKETCLALDSGILCVVDDALKRGISLILEGVHLVPDSKLINHWQQRGGVAVGVVLKISDPELHRRVIERRGEATAKGATEQLRNFSRIREIHDEIVRLGTENDWLVIDQRPRLEPAPIEHLQMRLQSGWEKKSRALET